MSQALVQILDYQEQNFSKIQDRPPTKARYTAIPIFLSSPFFLSISLSFTVFLVKKKHAFLSVLQD